MKVTLPDLGGAVVIVFLLVISGDVAIHRLRSGSTTDTVITLATLIAIWCFIAMYFLARPAVVPGRRLGGGLFHPALELRSDEHVEFDVRARNVDEWPALDGQLFVTNYRLLFVPLIPPLPPAALWLRRSRRNAVTIELDRIAAATDERRIRSPFDILGLTVPWVVVTESDGRRHVFWCRQHTQVLAAIGKRIPSQS